MITLIRTISISSIIILGGKYNGAIKLLCLKHENVELILIIIIFSYYFHATVEHLLLHYIEYIWRIWVPFTIKCFEQIPDITSF
jgi:hypothetical protein